jgi:hypothetical protein
MSVRDGAESVPHAREPAVTRGIKVIFYSEDWPKNDTFRGVSAIDAIVSAKIQNRK